MNIKEKKKEKKKKEDIKLDFNIEKNLTPYKEILQTKKSIKKHINLNRIVDDKNKEIFNLIKKRIGLPKSKKKKPNSLIKFEKGLKKYMIKNHFINNINEYEGNLFNSKIRTNFKEKIDFGHLVYYNIKDEENNSEKKINSIKSKYLELSHNYNIKKGYNAFENEYQKLKFQNKHLRYKLFKNNIENNNQDSNNELFIKHMKNKTQSNFYSPLNLSNNINNSSNNNTRNSLIFQLTTSINNNSKRRKKIDLKIPKLSIDTKINTENTNNNQKIILSEPNRKKISFQNLNKKLLKTKLLKRKSLKNLKNTILKKVTELKTTTNKCNNELFKIVDSSKIPEKDFRTYMILDMGEILEFKRKKNINNDTKHFFYKVKNEYEGMEKEKAEILTMTDKVTKLPDNVALFFVDRIVESYMKKKDLIDDVCKKISPVLANYKSRENMILREKLESNYFNIEKKGICLDFRREKLQGLFNHIFDINNQIKRSEKKIFSNFRRKSCYSDSDFNELSYENFNEKDDNNINDKNDNNNNDNHNINDKNDNSNNDNNNINNKKLEE